MVVDQAAVLLELALKWGKVQQMGLTFDLVFHYYFGDQLYLTVLLVGLLKEAIDFFLAEMAFLEFFLILIK